MVRRNVMPKLEEETSVKLSAYNPEEHTQINLKTLSVLALFVPSILGLFLYRSPFSETWLYSLVATIPCMFILVAFVVYDHKKRGTHQGFATFSVILLAPFVYFLARGYVQFINGYFPQGVETVSGVITEMREVRGSSTLPGRGSRTAGIWYEYWIEVYDEELDEHIELRVTPGVYSLLEEGQIFTDTWNVGLLNLRFKNL